MYIIEEDIYIFYCFLNYFTFSSFRNRELEARADELEEDNRALARELRRALRGGEGGLGARLEDMEDRLQVGLHNHFGIKMSPLNRKN